MEEMLLLVCTIALTMCKAGQALSKPYECHTAATFRIANLSEECMTYCQPCTYNRIVAVCHLCSKSSQYLLQMAFVSVVMKGIMFACMQVINEVAGICCLRYSAPSKAVKLIT